ncbi:MAG: DegT/DnrJ/EryC1/StrS family aminotransferase, partial [Chloroflexi bacterium]|nr:DegT/DnrJ/EryC1/StrS family aminotransferase [Chloroflexota bacterium]
RMTELQGAVALAQLRKLEDIVRRRRAWCSALSEALNGTTGIALPGVTAGCDASWWFYMMRVIPADLHASADTFAAGLRAEGVPVSAHYIGQCVYEYPLLADHSAFGPSDAGRSRGESHPCERHPYERRAYHHGLCPNAEAILDTCVSLSINEAYSRQDLEKTAQAIRHVAERLASSRAAS